MFIGVFIGFKIDMFITKLFETFVQVRGKDAMDSLEEWHRTAGNL